jgi:hypothetical protein
VAALGTLALASLSGCRTMHASVRDDSAGLNGGFEVVKQGLPVNWLVYTPKTIPTGSYELVIDTTQYHGGRQSLKFVVLRCSDVGGWHSPGFSGEFDATPGATYAVGLWVKNEGAEFIAKVGGVSATEGRYQTIVQASERIDSWKYFEHEYVVPAGFDKLRLEVNVLRPGTFWIDDVTIREVR